MTRRKSAIYFAYRERRGEWMQHQFVGYGKTNGSQAIEQTGIGNSRFGSDPSDRPQ